MATLEQIKKEYRKSGYSSSFETKPNVTEINKVMNPIRDNAPNPFKRESSGLGKVRDFVTDVAGGGKVAEGLGIGIASGGVQEGLEQVQQAQSQTELDLVKRIQEKQDSGDDPDGVTKLQFALKDIRESRGQTEEQQESFVEALPSTKEVVGSAVRLAATTALPTVAKGVSAKFVPVTSGKIAGGLRGAKVGTITGGLEGIIHGAGISAEEDGNLREIILGAGKGGLFGAGAGALLGGVIGAAVTPKGEAVISPIKDKKLELITPKAKELSPTEFQDELRRGRIVPKTKTEPARYVLTDKEVNTANKFNKLITKDPVKTHINFMEKISELDEETGVFLKQNKSIFNTGELRNSLKTALEDVDDLTLSEDRILKAKEKVIDGFIDSLEKNDTHTLWQARKLYDKQGNIDKAMKGAHSFNKDIKIAFRNAVQEFIADKTPDEVYKTKMGDMSGLFNLSDTVASKASKERMLSQLGKWAKENPIKAKTIAWAVPSFVAGGLFFGD